MKKFFALVLALVMALSLMTVAWGAPTAEETALQTDLNAGGTVTLSGDVVVNDGLTVPANTTVVLDLNGHTISGTDTTSASYGLINIKPGATLTINDSVGTGTITLSATTNRGWGGYSSVISNQRGTLVVNGGTIEHKGGTDMSYAIDNLTNTGAEPAKTTINGGVIKSTYIGIRQFCNSTTGNNALEINGGTIEGVRRSVWMQNPNSSVNDATLTITDGTFVGALTADIDDFDVAISGGTFNTDVSEYVVDGYRLVNGTVAAVPANTTGVVGGYEGMFTTVGATRQAITNLTKTLAVAPLDVDEDGYYNRPGDRIGSIEYYTLNFGGAVAQNYYRVDSVGDADLIVYVGDSKTPYMYLANEPAGGFTYVYGATVFNNFGKACGQFKYAAVDTTKTYYAYDGKVYVANPVGDVNLMVGGNFIQATDVTIAGTWVAHVPVYTQDKTGVVTAVKCANCPASAVIVANYACLPDAVKADDAYFNVPGSATKLFYWVDGVVVDTETKVESAETFDAGIAMYVGMSVMAAAGSAVVIGKKKD